MFFLSFLSFFLFAFLLTFFKSTILDCFFFCFGACFVFKKIGSGERDSIIFPGFCARLLISW